MNSFFSVISGVAVLFSILSVGILLSIRSRFAQLRMLPAAVRQFLFSLTKNKRADPTVSGYRALCTALAATVGTGNIAGVAGAIALGGPGVVFWLWICGILGMVTKFAEVTLSIHYRQKDADDHYVGGPMYVIKHGLPKKLHFLAYIYCFLGIVAALGIGNATQINAVCDGVKSIATTADIPFGKGASLVLGIMIALVIIPVFRNGAVGIGRLAERLVPFAAIVYVVLAVVTILIRAEYLAGAVCSILQGALMPRAVTGGMIGSALISLRVGISRGIFTNEAGMGTASIAHASSNVNHPVEQGLMGIVEVFLDTIVICTLTALVILTSGVPIPFGTDTGVVLTLDAFSSVLGDWCRLLLSILSCIFAFATILGWGLYGIRFCQFLFGFGAWKCFMAAQICAVIMGAVLQTSVIWALSEIVNGLMAIPNLIAISMLMPVFLSNLKNYNKKRTAEN